MSDAIITVERLGKRYRIGGRRESYFTLRESLAGAARSAARRLGGLLAGAAPGQGTETFWALKDVSFEVRRGEVVGIIGRNGAGKSTLLKILSRITEPTEGFARLGGRVGSLLEVGTGFHAELTGRENIYLSGAILGMKKAEIDRKFDEIVAFAEVEKFLDTPIKRYSSGMNVRLGFAVAAHLDPEILLVDEVLAVGDAEFQKKCLGKMSEVAQGGRTILFVSHNMGAVGSLCSSAIWIDGGGIRRRDVPSKVIGEYLNSCSVHESEVDLNSYKARRGTGRAKIGRASVKNSRGESTTHFQMGEDLILEFEVSAPQPVPNAETAFVIKTTSGISVLHFADQDYGFSLGELSGDRLVRVRIPELPLYTGTYLISLWVGDSMGNDYDYVFDCLSFDVSPGPLLRRHNSGSWEMALVAHRCVWEDITSAGS